MEPFRFLNALYLEACLSLGVFKGFWCYYSQHLCDVGESTGRRNKFQNVKWLISNLKVNWWNSDGNMNHSHQICYQTYCNLANQGTSVYGVRLIKVSNKAQSLHLLIYSFPQNLLELESYHEPCHVKIPLDLWTDGYKEKQSHSTPQKKMCENVVM